jgi:hypothetical protein
MVDVLNREIELVFMRFAVAAVLGATIGQHTEQ